MEFIIRKPENKNIIIFVHGLNGSELSWKGNSKRFVQNLEQEDIITNNFDMAIFSYGTRIFDGGRLTRVLNLIRGFFANRPQENQSKFNVGINSISEVLNSEIKSIEHQYTNIVIVAHSMGGLVSKSALTWMKEDVRKKVSLVVSLSVPHIGSNMAKIAKDLLGNNPQILDLQTMGTFTTELNSRYSDLVVKPRMIYQSGNQDTVVNRQSAIPPNVDSNDTISTADDHFSILLINDRANNVLYSTLIRELKQSLQPFMSVDTSVIHGTPFSFLIKTLASALNFRVEFQNFSDQELNMPLKEGTIKCNTIEELFLRTAALSIDRFPDFQIDNEPKTLNYILIKRI